MLALALIVSCGAASARAQGEWSIELTREGGAIIRYDGARTVDFNYVAFAAGWKFAAFETAIGANNNETWPITGNVKVFDLKVNGNIQRQGDQFVFEWNYTADKPSTNNIGGGLDFEFRLDKQIFGDKEVPKPILTETGWTWTPLPGQTIEVKFDRLAGKPFYEKNRSHQIRTYFLPRDIEPGTHTARMTLTLPPGARRVNSNATRYAKYDPQTWRASTLDWKAAPLDLSYLNDKPAGRRGFVKADGDRLVFEDGTEARFWGCNVSAYAIFSATDEQIEQQAKRIAALGFNLVRLHHHDSANFSPTVFRSGGPDTRTLDEQRLSRVDYWTKCLKENGVYVWLDLHVGRPFLPGDQIDAYEELSQGKAGRQAKGLSYVNRSVTERLKEFATAYLTRKNTYTGVRYVDEPAIMGVLITNENDITHHFGNLFLPDKKLSQHQKLFEPLRDQIVRERKLNASQAWKTWEPGDAKIVLNEIEYRWHRDFIEHLRGLGLRVPIATTSTWGSNPLFSLPALTVGDVIDVHAYGAAESLSSNPKYDDMSSHWIAAAQVANKPLTVTEWNTPFPQRDRFTQPLFIAAHAAFQQWDAPMVFGYHQAPLTPKDNKIDEFAISNDPSLLAMMPAAALLFREGHVRPADKTVVFSPSVRDLFWTNLSPDNSPALRTIAERHRLVIGLPSTPLLPWLKGVAGNGARSNPSQLADGVTDDAIVSDTNEIRRNWRDGIATIDTPRTQAALGWIGEREIRLGDVIFRVRTPKAAIAVTALDGKEIATSRKMLISVAAQTHVGKGQIFAEPVVGTVTFTAPIAEVRPLAPNGAIGAPMPVTDRHAVELTVPQTTHWFLVTR